jgi:hypothetical protein
MVKVDGRVVEPKTLLVSLQPFALTSVQEGKTRIGNAGTQGTVDS